MQAFEELCGPAEHWIEANDQRLFVETFGNPANPAVLLVMGNSAPGLVWPDGFCENLAQRSLFVIRFDQRDTGLSSYVDFSSSPYTLNDLVDDALGVLDSMNLSKANVVGLSQGGVLAYRMAIRAPDRISALTVLMSSADLRPKNDAFAGAPARPGELPRPERAYVDAVIALNSVGVETEEEVARQFVENFRLAKGPVSPFDEHDWLKMGQAIAARPRLRSDGQHTKMANHSNHSMAQKATPPLCAEDLAGVTLPVHLIHGTHDPIFPIKHATWAAEQLVGAELFVIDDMGHALDRAFFDPVIGAMDDFWKRRT